PYVRDKVTAENPDTNPLRASVTRYHRQEEARHLSFARTTLPELYGRTGRLERLRIRHFAPVVIQLLFRMFVHPGVYSAVGLPGWKTWRAVHRTAGRLAVPYHATRNIVRTLLDPGLFAPGRVP